MRRKTGGLPDSCDICPEAYNPLQADGDLDYIGDSGDNCPSVYNSDQADKNDIGDACEGCCRPPGPIPAARPLLRQAIMVIIFISVRKRVSETDSGA